MHTPAGVAPSYQMAHGQNFIFIVLVVVIIRESVDSLCRDGAGPPIVCVHWKAVLTRERSCSKPFWTPRLSYSDVSLPNDTPQVAKKHP